MRRIFCTRFFLAAATVQHHPSCLETTRINPQIHQLPRKWIGNYLEDEGGKRRSDGAGPGQAGLTLVGTVAFYLRGVEGRGQIGEHGIEQLLHPFVFEGAAT